MTGKQKQSEVERDGVGKRLHKRAVDEEVKWRTAHGIDDELRTKRQTKTKPHHQVERGEARRREERQQQRIDRTLLARPLLVPVKDDRPRLIKASEMPPPPAKPTPSRSAEPPSSGYGVRSVQDKWERRQARKSAERALKNKLRKEAY